MKTSHFRSPKLDSDKHVRVQISLGTPRYWRRDVHGELVIVRLIAPDAWALRAYRNDPEPYEEAYRSRLEKVGLSRIRTRLDDVAAAHPGKEIVLLCFEDLTVPGAWCHRRLFADWLQERTGEVVEEL